MYQLKIDYNTSYVKDKKIYLVFDLETLVLIEETKGKVSEIKDKLYEKIPSEDKEFIEVGKETTNEKGIYIFDVEKWIKKTIKETVINTADRFEKKLKIGKLPALISIYVNQSLIDKVVLGSFRNYIEKNSKLKKILLNSLPGNFKSLSYLRFEYDSYFNYINFSLLPELRINPLLYINKEERKKSKKMTFDESVYAILKTL